MHHHPAAQAQRAASDAPHPRATSLPAAPSSALEALLLSLLHSLLIAVLGAASAPPAAWRTRSVLRLLATIARLVNREGAARSRTGIPRCQRHHEGERQILLALLYGPRPRPRARPAAMPPARPRRTRDPPPHPCAETAAHPHRIRTPRMLR
jgi:hypothetical protein